jgi:hypothetical protein
MRRIQLLTLPGFFVVFCLLAPTAASAQTATIPWSWSKAPNHYPRVDLTARVRHGSYVLREVPRPRRALTGRAELRYELRKGGVTKVVWRTRISERQGLARAAMVVSGQRIFVARHSLIATTCTLYAFARRTGRQLWKVTLRGIGPAMHSKWYNRVQLRIIGSNPVVFGHEGPGRSYVEMRSAATGGLVSNRKFRMRRPAQPLAERLFEEVHRALRRARTYRRTVAAFLSGHGIRPRSPGVAVADFQRAVRQVNGLPLAHGRYRLVARLVRRPTGAYVIRARRR